MNKVRIGIVGYGNMGRSHAANLLKGQVKGGILAGICDISENKRKLIQELDKDLLVFEKAEDMIASDDIDAILVATPHYDHPIIGIQGFKAGKHMLLEKPIGVYTKIIKDLNQAAEESEGLFTIMYNQRTNPVYQKVKDMVDSGELGDLIRIHWVITDWFRSEFYYQSGGWRATWKGEGGGVLINQCPHQIDLLQWMFGMPSKVRGFLSYGKYHDIEVEDDVTAYMEFENGATGMFVTSTGEAPGTNRLEVSGTKGKLVVEKNQLTFYRNRQDLFDFTKSSKEGFAKPENWTCTIPVEGHETGHVGIMQNFVDGILHGTQQLAPGQEGIKGLTISNAIHLSSWLDKEVTLPIDDELFYNLLQDKISKSKVEKEDKDVILDVAGSH